MNPLVSVIIPTFNRIEYIGECLDSILSQTYKQIEILVIDDGSTDNTDKEIKRYGDKRLKYIILEHSGIPSIPRNEGIRRASGNFMAFCDSDDIWSPKKLEIQMALISENKWNACSTDAWIIGSNGKRYFDDYKRKYDDPLLEILWNNYVITSSIVINSDYIHDLQFNTSRSLVGYEDYYLWLSVSTKTVIEYIDEPLIGYRKHSESLSSKIELQSLRKLTRILLTHPVYYHHPSIFLLKSLRMLKHLLI